MNQQKTPIDINPYERKRTRAKQRHRLWEGFKQLRKPMKTIPVLLLVVVSVIAWNMKDGFVEQFPAIPLLMPVVSLTVAAAVPIFFMLLLAGLLSLIGTPKQARDIDDDVATVLAEKDYYKRPFLISRAPLSGDAEVLTFWSRWISIEKWRENETAILDTLNLNALSSIRYGGKRGNNRRLVVLVVGHGATPPERPTLYGDEF